MCLGGRDQRRGVRAGGSGDVVPQGDDRENAGDAGEDEGGFHDPGGEESERGRLTLPLEHGVQHDGGADAGQADDDLREGGPHHAGVAAGAQDEVADLILDGLVQPGLPQLVSTCAALAYEPRSCPRLRYQARRDTAAWPRSCRCPCRWPSFRRPAGTRRCGRRRRTAGMCLRAGPMRAALTSGYISEQARVCPRPSEVRSEPTMCGITPNWRSTPETCPGSRPSATNAVSRSKRATRAGAEFEKVCWVASSSTRSAISINLCC